MSWLLIGLATISALGLIFYFQVLEPWRRLCGIAGRIARNEPVESFLLRGVNVFGKLAADLETIAGNQLRLAGQIHERQFNQDAILASMSEGVVVVDGDRTIRLVNDSFLKLFYLQKAPNGETLLSTLRNSELEELVRAALKHGTPQSREVSVVRNPAASHVMVNVMPLKTPEEEMSGAVIVFHDISRLRELEEVRKEFVANVSHELRTPLSILSGYLENLLDQPTMARKQQAEVFSTMERHAKRLNALLDDLLTLARLESHGDQLDLETIRVEPLIRELIRDWKNRLGAKNITLSLDISPGLPEINADQFRLQQVLDNLLDNAVKYSKENGAILLSASLEEGSARISIQDDGMGIPPADLPHIFERFYRVDKARSRDKGGTGLGLSIVKHIVAAHGGRVGARSEYGKGTTISLYLPLHANIQPERKNGSQPSTATKKVLALAGSALATTPGPNGDEASR